MNTEHEDPRVGSIAQESLVRTRVRTNRMFASLMVLQCLAAIIGALVISPNTWAGTEHAVHAHVLAAIFIGVPLAVVPIFLALRFPAEYFTQHVVGVAQVLFSALFIHISGGRIETHFHIFGSLAFLAFYRDWRTLMAPTAVVAVDHLWRGIFWPESVFGVLAAAPWRALEHAGWVAFEAVFLVFSCVTARRDVVMLATKQVALEDSYSRVEAEVQERTGELQSTLGDLEGEISENRRLQGELLQAQKLESIGQLAAGIAHEINTPTQYVSDNTRFLQSEFENVVRVIEEYELMLSTTECDLSRDDRIARVNELREELDFEFLRSEIPLAITQSLDGIDRIARIVRAMKDFSHPGTEGKEPADINKAIESTTTVCRTRWKYVADLELELDPGLPHVPCLVAEFNQVILNLIVNAADAISERFGEGGDQGRITIRSRVDGDAVEIAVQDNGGGIPDSVIGRVFDPFFTTKGVGKGTGQGLSISRDVIVKQHGGAISCTAEPGEGTTFLVRLPLEETDADRPEGDGGGQGILSDQEAA